METDDLLPLSGLQHMAFCERQCALIHVEGIWVENRLTIEGRHLHERVDEVGEQVRDGVRIVRALPLRSNRLRLVGKADVVEFGPDGPYPVEYKRGARKVWTHDEVQLCAQAICLEEMLGVAVKRGALYYVASRRRREVEMDADLRRETEETAARFHRLVAEGRTPAAIFMPKCRGCSLIEHCIPSVANGAGAEVRYLKGLSCAQGGGA